MQGAADVVDDDAHNDNVDHTGARFKRADVLGAMQAMIAGPSGS